MLSREDNEFLCRTDRGTPMGELMRRYWHPFLLSRELPENDGVPVRVRLLGEDLVAFRDTEGNVGLMQERCPHRGASLYYGVNMQGGLMCVYHGWKFDHTGACVDVPSDLPGVNFKEKVQVISYPVIESADALWTYMGPPEKQPVLPSYVYHQVPVSHVVAYRTPIYCNYLQSVEGNIDSTHTGTLHMHYAERTPVDLDADQPGYPTQAFSRYLRATVGRGGRIDVQDTDYGLRLIAVRETPKGNQHIRINCHVFPLTTFVATFRGGVGSNLIHVPIDDYNNMRFGFRVRTDRPWLPEERAGIIEQFAMDPANPKLRLKRKDNEYLINRQAQKTLHPPGIFPGPEQDYCVTETMGEIFDRTQEQLYHADAAIIRLRQQLMIAAQNLLNGIDPPALSPDIAFDKIRSEEVIIGPNEDPWKVATHAGETAGRNDRTFVLHR